MSEHRQSINISTCVINVTVGNVHISQVNRYDLGARVCVYSRLLPRGRTITRQSGVHVVRT